MYKFTAPIIQNDNTKYVLIGLFDGDGLSQFIADANQKSLHKVKF